MGFEIDFLPVGEGGKSGDAICLRYGNLHGNRFEQTVVVIDAGFASTGERVAEHIGTYYKTDTVDIVISTHPDADHINGILPVLERLRVRELWMHQPWNHADAIGRSHAKRDFSALHLEKRLQRSLEAAAELEEAALTRGIPIFEPFAGLGTADNQIAVVGPTREYYQALLQEFRVAPAALKSAAKTVGSAIADAGAQLFERAFEKWHIETLDDSGETSAENNSSAIILLRLFGEQIMLTADAGSPAITRALDFRDQYVRGLEPLRLVQVPHHGSRRNVGPSLLDRWIGVRTREGELLRAHAVVSAAADGAPKHPSKRVTNAFTRRGCPVLVTRGMTITYGRDKPARPGWGPLSPEPLHEEVED